MPGYDGTGPEGRGSMTGGGRGYCAVPAEKMEDRGFVGRPRMGRCGQGRRRGCRNQYYATGLTGWQRDAANPSGESQKQ